jgi:hypothetical protein
VVCFGTDDIDVSLQACREVAGLAKVGFCQVTDE